MADPRSPSRLVDADILSRARHLGLEAKRVVEGYRVGEHRSPAHGFAIEFAQHREYSPGDDTRHLDWKLLAKSEKLFIKQYEQDTNFVAHLLVDGSESMAYGSGLLTKFEASRILAASICELVFLQGDAVALTLFDDHLREQITRTDSRQNLLNICKVLAEFVPQRTTDLTASLSAYSPHLHRRGIVILLSDLLVDPDVFLQALRRLAMRGSEVIVFQVLDPAEIHFHINGNFRFLGLEASGNRSINTRDLRKDYLAAFSKHLRAIRRACETCSATHHLVDIGLPLSESLATYLASRRRIL
ncbi:MAG: DUF58 domain-containing protein [Puniceicoccaceae bacterium]